jgi:hypothetical protein
MQALHQRQLLHAQRALSGRDAPQLALQPLAPALDDEQVGQRELGAHGLRLAHGVDRAQCWRHRVVGEGAHDDGERVGLPQRAEDGRRDGLAALLARPLPARQVHVAHLGVRELARLEQRGKAIEPVVRHLHDRAVDAPGAEGSHVGLGARQRVEHGRLAGAR